MGVIIGMAVGGWLGGAWGVFIGGLLGLLFFGGASEDGG